MLIFSSLCFFYILTIIYRFYVCFEGTGKDQVDSDYKNGPKPCQMRRLGTRYVHFFIFVFFT
jgi:hypothetical protein